jgi:hypothetical protein
MRLSDGTGILDGLMVSRDPAIANVLIVLLTIFQAGPIMRARMNVVPPDFPASGEAAPASECAPFAPVSDAIGAKWAALHEAGAVVCALAGEEPAKSSAEIRNFPAMIREAGPGRRALAENGIDDLVAMMEPGIAALLAVNARGIDATHAARALWREFIAARAALFALVPPSGALGPRRTA